MSLSVLSPASRAIDFPFVKVTVLVVDDSRAQRAVVCSNLKKWGFSVREAANGLEALKICEAEKINIVLCDWMMPEMDGPEFCAALRNLKWDHYIYFILLTSKSDRYDVAHGLENGADDFLTKPVDAIELHARLKAGLRLLDMENQLIRQNERTQSALAELQRLYESLHRDLIEAAKLQDSLMPVRDRQFPDGRVSLHLKSASHVGGDLAGFFRFTEDRIGIYSIDVSGHGVSSALMTARLAGCLNSQNKALNAAFERMADGFYRHRSPDEVATVLNERLLEDIDTELYYTLAFADIDMKSGQVSLVQAGHPNPAVLDAQGGVTYHGGGGLPVGLIEGATFDRTEFTLNPGDRLMLYTDGITECEDPNGKALGKPGLRRLLARHVSDRGLELLDNLFSELSRFAGKAELDDDISAIVFEYTPAKGRAGPA